MSAASTARFLCIVFLSLLLFVASASLASAQTTGACPKTSDPSVGAGGASDSCRVCVYDDTTGNLNDEYGKSCVVTTANGGQVNKECKGDRSVPAGKCRTTYTTADGKQMTTVGDKPPEKTAYSEDDLRDIYQDTKDPNSNTTVPPEYNQDAGTKQLISAFDDASSRGDDLSPAPQTPLSPQQSLLEGLWREITGISELNDVPQTPDWLSNPFGETGGLDPAEFKSPGAFDPFSGELGQFSTDASGFQNQPGISVDGGGNPFVPPSNFGPTAEGQYQGMFDRARDSAQVVGQKVAEASQQLADGVQQFWDQAVENSASVYEQLRSTASEGALTGINEPSISGSPQEFLDQVSSSYRENADWLAAHGISEDAFQYMTITECGLSGGCGSSTYGLAPRDLGATPGTSIIDPGETTQERLNNLLQDLSAASERVGPECMGPCLAKEVNPLYDVAQIEPQHPANLGATFAESCSSVLSWSCASFVANQINPFGITSADARAGTISTQACLANPTACLRSFENVEVSYYDPKLGGINCDGECSRTATGELFNRNAMTFATQRLPYNSVAIFCNGSRCVAARANDTGAFDQAKYNYRKADLTPGLKNALGCASTCRVDINPVGVFSNRAAAEAVVRNINRGMSPAEAISTAQSDVRGSALALSQSVGDQIITGSIAPPPPLPTRAPAAPSTGFTEGLRPEIAQLPPDLPTPSPVREIYGGYEDQPGYPSVPSYSPVFNTRDAAVGLLTGATLSSRGISGVAESGPGPLGVADQYESPDAVPVVSVPAAPSPSAQPIFSDYEAAIAQLDAEDAEQGEIIRQNLQASIDDAQDHITSLERYIARTPGSSAFSEYVADPLRNMFGYKSIGPAAELAEAKQELAQLQDLQSSIQTAFEPPILTASVPGPLEIADRYESPDAVPNVGTPSIELPEITVQPDDYGSLVMVGPDVASDAQMREQITPPDFAPAAPNFGDSTTRSVTPAAPAAESVESQLRQYEPVLFDPQSGAPNFDTAAPSEDRSTTQGAYYDAFGNRYDTAFEAQAADFRQMISEESAPPLAVQRGALAIQDAEPFFRDPSDESFDVPPLPTPSPVEAERLRGLAQQLEAEGLLPEDSKVVDDDPRNPFVQTPDGEIFKPTEKMQTIPTEDFARMRDDALFEWYKSGKPFAIDKGGDYGNKDLIAADRMFLDGKYGNALSNVNSKNANEFLAEHPDLSEAVKQYVIGGMDPRLRTSLYAAMSDRCGDLTCYIMAGYRDDDGFRPAATGKAAAPQNSYHGGSNARSDTNGSVGYGTGQAADIGNVGGTELQQFIHEHGEEYGLRRPYGNWDAPHVALLSSPEKGATADRAQVNAIIQNIQSKPVSVPVLESNSGQIVVASRGAGTTGVITGSTPRSTGSTDRSLPSTGSAGPIPLPLRAPVVPVLSPSLAPSLAWSAYNRASQDVFAGLASDAEILAGLPQRVYDPTPPVFETPSAVSEAVPVSVPPVDFAPAAPNFELPISVPPVNFTPAAPNFTLFTQVPPVDFAPAAPNFELPIRVPPVDFAPAAPNFDLAPQGPIASVPSAETVESQLGAYAPALFDPQSGRPNFGSIVPHIDFTPAAPNFGPDTPESQLRLFEPVLFDPESGAPNFNLDSKVPPVDFADAAPNFSSLTSQLKNDFSPLLPPSAIGLPAPGGITRSFIPDSVPDSVESQLRAFGPTLFDPRSGSPNFDTPVQPSKDARQPAPEIYYDLFGNEYASPEGAQRADEGALTDTNNFGYEDLTTGESPLLRITAGYDSPDLKPDVSIPSPGTEMFIRGVHSLDVAITASMDCTLNPAECDTYSEQSALLKGYPVPGPDVPEDVLQKYLADYYNDDLNPSGDSLKAPSAGTYYSACRESYGRIFCGSATAGRAIYCSMFECGADLVVASKPQRDPNGQIITGSTASPSDTKPTTEPQKQQETQSAEPPTSSDNTSAAPEKKAPQTYSPSGALRLAERDLAGVADQNRNRFNPPSLSWDRYQPNTQSALEDACRSGSSSACMMLAYGGGGPPGSMGALPTGSSIPQTSQPQERFPQIEDENSSSEGDEKEGSEKKAIVILIPNPRAVNMGETARISWASIYTAECTLSAGDGTVLVAHGKSDDSIESAALSTTTRFSIACAPSSEATGAAATSSVEVEVRP